ncbi:SRPBCC domain-containing protein [Flavobacterium sp. W22_SRS_FK3]|uniref:SRPBCC domain-containing protein n=1 Tax=Flavobacterium sp. W22_SRS_FK3 TaxID=3240275 RepID=UPI003F920D72
MITVKTIVNASIGKVWEFWTTPKYIQKWNNPTDEWHTPYVENDLEAGGKFKYTMARKDESISFNYEGIYTKIDNFLVIEYRLLDNRIGSVLFENQNDKVKITEIFEPEAVNSKSEQKQFCQAVIDNFKKYTEAN